MNGKADSGSLGSQQTEKNGKLCVWLEGVSIWWPLTTLFVKMLYPLLLEFVLGVLGYIPPDFDVIKQLYIDCCNMALASGKFVCDHYVILFQWAC